MESPLTNRHGAVINGSPKPVRMTPPFLPLLLAVAGVMGMAFLARALGFERVFLDDGTVVFSLGDAFYHARRAFYSFANFPGVLSFDTCINFPNGSVVPHPPLLDWMVGGLAHFSGDSLEHFERVSAWSPVVFGVLAVIPIFALGRMLESASVGLGAGLLYALLPISIEYSKLGNPDHHAAAGLIGAALLTLYASVLSDGRSRRSTGWSFAGLCICRAAMLLVWTGSLLYLVVGEIAIVAAGSAQGRRSQMGAQAASCLGTVALVAPVVWLLPTPNGGAFSATELSGLHLLTFFSLALVTAGGLVWEQLRPSAGARERLLRMGGLAAATGACWLLVPGLVEAILPAFSFLAKSDSYTALVVEQLPLFYQQGGLHAAAGEQRMGYFAYLIPLAPLVYLLRAEGRDTARGLFLFVWSVVFGVLAIQQFRYAHDFAPAGCVAFAVLLSWAGKWVAERLSRPRLAGAIAMLCGVVLWAPTLPRYFWPRLEIMTAYLQGRLAGLDRGLLTIEGTQVRFAQRVRLLTPPTPGCSSSDASPDYGILAHPGMGHVLHYVAERATPADPFGPYIGRENFRAVTDFLEAESEEAALRIAAQLHTPLVLTAEEGGDRPEQSIVQRLHREDGSARGTLLHLERFRLLDEGPKGGVAMSIAFEASARSSPPYKLFAIVPGAVLEVPSPAGSGVFARLRILTPTGRRFVFLARSTADEDGIARMRVPYPTSAAEGARAIGAYQVRSGTRSFTIHVDEASVREGRTVKVEEDPARG